jgi:hypothetical protein
MSNRIPLYVLFALTVGLIPSASAAARQSDTAFVLNHAGVIPENIVYDAPRDRFLGGDLEKDGMVELRRDGSIRPFATAADIDGRALGLKIDAQIGPFDPRKAGGSLAPVLVLKLPLEAR